MKALSVSGLHKTYTGGVQALSGIDFSVEEGDFFALLGPNGAGKSTAIGIITSLVNKSAGSIRVFDHDLDTDLTAVKACIGLVPQEFNFNTFEPTREIVLNQAGYYGIPRAEASIRAEFLLRELDLWDKRREVARNLSGGMKRRLMIARALVHRPRLLILDEPTAGVDIEIRRSMWRFLREINREGTTIILTTHYLEEAESLCRNIAIIDDGQIIEDTSMKSLLAKLQVEHFILDLHQPIDALPDLPGYRAHWIDELSMEVEVDKGQGINELFAMLTQRGIEVTSLRNKSNRLEELFMHLVEQGATRSTESAA